MLQKVIGTRPYLAVCLQTIVCSHVSTARSFLTLLFLISFKISTYLSSFRMEDSPVMDTGLMFISSRLCFYQLRPTHVFVGLRRLIYLSKSSYAGAKVNRRAQNMTSKKGSPLGPIPSLPCKRKYSAFSESRFLLN